MTTPLIIPDDVQRLLDLADADPALYGVAFGAGRVTLYDKATYADVEVVMWERAGAIAMGLLRQMVDEAVKTDA